MKFAVSVAMVVLLLGMPLGCMLAAYPSSAPSHPCCPRHQGQTTANLKCPYDTLDQSTGGSFVVTEPEQPVSIAPPVEIARALFVPATAEDRGDLNLLHCILRI
jgi:hypothetical protein